MPSPVQSRTTLHNNALPSPPPSPCNPFPATPAHNRNSPDLCPGLVNSADRLAPLRPPPFPLQLLLVVIMTFVEDFRLKVYAAMWTLTFFLMLQLVYQPSANHMLNRVDAHALIALIINLNVYLLVLPSSPIVTASAWDTAIELGVLVMHATVAVHLILLLLLGVKQIGKSVLGLYLKRQLALTAGTTTAGASQGFCLVFGLWDTGQGGGGVRGPQKVCSPPIPPPLMAPRM